MPIPVPGLRGAAFVPPVMVLPALDILDEPIPLLPPDIGAFPPPPLSPPPHDARHDAKSVMMTIDATCARTNFPLSDFIRILQICPVGILLIYSPSHECWIIHAALDCAMRALSSVVPLFSQR